MGNGGQHRFGHRCIAAVTLASVIAAGTVAAVVTSAVAPSPASAYPTAFTSNGSCVDGTYTVPAGITAVHIVAIGHAGGAGQSGEEGEGGNGSGGAGGRGSKVEVTVPVTPGSTLYAGVADDYSYLFPSGAGHGGGPGGSTPSSPVVNIGGPGGAASYVANADPGSTCAPAASSLLTVAAGGGGGGAAGDDNGGGGGTEGASSGNGGDGGTNRSDDGAGGHGAASGGTGGAGGYNTFSSFYDCAVGDVGGPGGTMQGGGGGNAGAILGSDGHCQNDHKASGSGGGGGGGYQGGGGGGGASTFQSAGGGGGAGASWVLGNIYDRAPAATYEQPGITIEPVYTAPLIVSSNASITSPVGGQISLLVRSTGYPLPSIRHTGDIPQGVHLTDNDDGTATLAGSPSVYTGGRYDATIIAENHDASGATHSTSQSITIFVNETPRIYSDNITYFDIGHAGSFTVKTQTSYPLNPAITETGTLPAGITLTDNHNGTATIGGTPTAAAGGIYPITLKAQNSAGQSTTQAFTIQVLPIPIVTTIHSTSNPSAVGTAVTFSASTSPPASNVYVRFEVDGAQLGFFSTNNNGVATATPLATLSAGPHTITGTINGNTNFQASTGTLTQNVSVLSSSASGTSLTTSPTPASTLYFQDAGTARVWKVDASGTNPSYDYYPGASGMASDAAGNLYVYTGTLGGAQRVQKITPQGVRTTQGADLSYQPGGLAADPAGNAYVADAVWHRIVQETASGSQRVLVSGVNPATSSVYNLSGIAVDSAGNLYFSETSYDKVYVLPPPYSGTPQVISSGVDGPQGLAVNAAGDLFIADYGNNRIVKIPAGGSAQTLATVSRPHWLTIDASGTLFVTSDTTNEVLRLPSPYTGTPTVVASNHTMGGVASVQPPTAVTDIQAYSLKATVISSPVGGTPTGTVTFRKGTTTLGTATLAGSNPSTATLAMAAGTLPIGSHEVTASYGGNGSFPGSVSAPVTVDVSSSVLHVSVTGSQGFGGGNKRFVDSRPTTPAGVSFAGSLSGCQTSVTANQAIGSYPSTITSCGGLSLTGANAANYTIAYDDDGFSVTKPQVTVRVTGTLPYQGTATFTGALVTPPTGITGTSGSLTCTTSASNTAAFATYQGTISGCHGLNLTGSESGSYIIDYVDGGVTVIPGPVKITVTGAQTYLGTPTFTATNPANLPTGITAVTGTMTGCTTSVTAAADAATYQGTISGCSGLSLTGSTTALWAVTYVDGGMTVNPQPLAVTVTGNQPYNNNPTFSYAQPAAFPTGITKVSGVLSGCTTSLSRTAAIGFYPAPVINTAGCTGLVPTGAKAVDYRVTYVDGGINVFPGPTGTTLTVSPRPEPELYVTDTARFGTPGLRKLSPPYTSAETISLGTTYRLLNPNGVAVDASGNRFVSDQSFGVFKITPGGTTSLVLSRGDNVGGVAVDAQDNLFVTLPRTGEVVELVYPYTDAPVVIATGQTWPSRIAVDSAGDVFFTTDDGFIKVLTQPYTTAPAVVQTLGGLAAAGLAVDGAGNLYWDTYNQGGSGEVFVRKVGPPYTGAPIDMKGTATPKNPYGIAVDASGSLYFGDNTYGLVDGNQGKVWKVTSGTGTALPQTITNPTAVAVSQPPTRVVEGTAVTLAATVISSPPGNFPTGAVEFVEGSTVLGSANLTGTGPDIATFVTTSLTPGTHTITARYVGNATYPTSISGPATVEVFGSTVTVPVSATQTFGGTPTFSSTLPSTAPGVSITGSLTGCSTSVSTATHVGTHLGTITGCTGLSLTGANADGFTLAYVDAGVTVSQAPVSVGVAGTQPYGGTPTFSVDSVPDLPDGVNQLDGSLASCTTSKSASSAVGLYMGTISGCGGLSLLGPNGGDYLVSFVDHGLSVTSVPVTVTVTGSRVFGGSSTFSKTNPSLPSGITVGGTLSGCATTVDASADVGSYPNTISTCSGLSLSGATSANYTLGYADGGFSVTPANVSVTVTGTQVYGGTPTFDFTPPASFPSGIDGVTGTVDCTTSKTAATPVGTYSGTISACDGVTPTGVDSSNYAVAFTDGGFEVTRATLTVTPDDKSIDYGDPDPSFTFAITGYQNNDPASVVTSPPTCGVAGAHTAGGTYTIACSGGSATNYSLDVSATATLAVNQSPQTITFGSLADKRFDEGPITVAASASSGLPVTFSSATSSVCSVLGTTVSFHTGATAQCTINADQAGSSQWAPAPRRTQSFSITPGHQAISFGTLPDKAFDEGPITVAATASSGLAVAFSSATPTVCSVLAGSVSFLMPSATCTIAADQAGNPSWAAAPQVTRSFSITRADQSISFAPLTTKRFDQGPITVGATASSGLPVTFSSTTPSVCSVSGTSVSFVSGASAVCTIAADQAGSTTWAPAPQVTRSFTITPGNQAITFAALANQLYGAAPLTVGATASSGLPVTFASLTTPVCSVSGAAVTLLAPGTCTVQASQAGNANYAGATPISRSFTVGFSSPCITTRVKTSFTVKAGQSLCIDGGTVDKAISVEAGGSLWVRRGTLKGSVTTTRARAVTICSTTMSGSVKVSESTGPVTVGGVGCGNYLAGSVTITKNTGGVLYAYNGAGGSVTVTDNRGGFVYGNNTASGKVTLKNNL